MNDTLDFHNATLLDAMELTTNIRRADRDELRALGHESIGEVVCESIEASDVAVAVREMDTGKLICIYGFAPLSLISGAAAPWFLATDLIYDHQFEFMRRSRHIVELAKTIYTYQFNLVAAENTDVVGYLNWLGYDFGEPFQHPETGEMVMAFTMTGDFDSV